MKYEEVPEKITDRIVSALRGEMGDDQRRIAEVFVEQLDKALRKNHDYGNTVFRHPVLAPNLPPDSAILVRWSDKIDRLHNLSKVEGKVDESIADTVGDAGVYAFLWLVQQRRREEGEYDESLQSMEDGTE